MTPSEVLYKLVNEHFSILDRDAEVKQQIVKTLVDQKMTEFFSVNWRRLHRDFIAGLKSPRKLIR